MNKKKIIGLLIVIAGLLVYVYPTISSIYNEYLANAQIRTIITDTSENEDENEAEIEKAAEYNESLLERFGRREKPEAGSDALGTDDEELYESLLSGSGGAMGFIEIPCISQRLPIYHYADDDSLEKGVGHVYGSSLPVGGTGTNCVLTGHRGLAGNLLFTRLDEVKENDMIYMTVFGQTLAYIVTDISVMLPEDAENISIDPDKDLVTLITCTPYGVNSHRLVITAERTEYTESEPVLTDMEVLVNAVSFKKLYIAGGILLIVVTGMTVNAFHLAKETKKGEDKLEKQDKKSNAICLCRTGSFSYPFILRAKMDKKPRI